MNSAIMRLLEEISRGATVCVRAEYTRCERGLDHWTQEKVATTVSGHGPGKSLGVTDSETKTGDLASPALFEDVGAR